MAISLKNLFESRVCKNATDVAGLAGVHRSTVDADKSRIYGLYLVIPFRL